MRFLRRLSGILIIATSQWAVFAADTDFVGVAYYSPRPEYKADAARVIAILREHKITVVTTESASAQINIPANQAAEARALIAEAVEKEKLRIKVLPADPEPLIPRLIGKLPEQSDGPMQYDARKHGVRIGLSKPKDVYHLNHRINIWMAYECEEPLPKGFHWKTDDVALTHPDGTVSHFRGDTRIDVLEGPGGLGSWGGGMSDTLHNYVRKPGLYKMQWKLGDLESGAITWRMIP